MPLIRTPYSGHRRYARELTRATPQHRLEKDKAVLASTDKVALQALLLLESCTSVEAAESALRNAARRREQLRNRRPPV